LSAIYQRWNRERLAIGRPPFDGSGCRIERAEPDLRRRFLASCHAIAVDRDGFAQIIVADQGQKSRFAGTKARGAAVELAGLADHAAVLWRGGAVAAAECLGVCLTHQAGQRAQ
jgi:hypothetical protein